MYSEASPQHCRRLPLLALTAVLLVSAGCGHKDKPFPPPLRHPAASKDLVVSQRGNEYILTFSYPQTTISGTVVEPLAIVEYWQLDRSAPKWVPPTEEEGEPTDEAAPGEETETATTGTANEIGPDETDDALPVFEGIAGSGNDPSRPDEQAPEGDAGDNVTLEAEMQPDADEDAMNQQEAPEAPTLEKLLAIDGREFSATSSLRTTLEGSAVETATFGSQIVFSLPIEPIEPIEPVEEADESADDSEEAPDTEAAAEVELEHGTIFAVKTGVNEHLISSFSNVVVMGRRDAPAPPEAFELEDGPAGVTLTWPKADTDILGYNVYRRDAQSPVYGTRIAFVPASKPPADDDEEPSATEESDEDSDHQHVDRSAIYGQRYIYALTAVSHQRPLVESGITTEHEVDYADRFAPSPPQGVIALAESGRVRLLWNASPQDDVAGYTVLRGGRDGDLERLFDEPQLELEYSDRDVRSGQGYRYQVVAVDELGNESAASTTVEVRAP